MKLFFTSLFLAIYVISYGQNEKTSIIESEISYIEKNIKNLNYSEIDWNEFKNLTTDNGGIIKIWKQGDTFVKIIEEIGGSTSVITRVLYLKNEKPIKGIEIEKMFAKKPNFETDYTKLIENFKLEVYITGFNKNINENEFEIKSTGKRVFSEYYCDMNSLFQILEELKTE